MKTFNISLDINPKYLVVVPLSDIHLGDPLLNKKKLQETIDYIKDNDNVYCVLNGDLMNTTTKSSLGCVYSQELTPMQQIQMLVELLEPIKDKILVATGGNHERRIKNETSIDITEIAMIELGLRDRYTPEGYYLYLYFGEKTYGRKAPIVYTIYGSHGSGGGRSIGSKINKAVSMSNIVIADIFVMRPSARANRNKKGNILTGLPK